MWTTAQSGVVHNPSKMLVGMGFPEWMIGPPGLPPFAIYLAKTMALWTTGAILGARNINDLQPRWTTK